MESIGRTALFITFALLAGLLAGLRWFEPFAPGIFPNAGDIPLVGVLMEKTDSIANSLTTISGSKHREELLIPLNDKLLTDVLAHAHPKSQPFAVVSFDKLYYIDDDGYMIGPAELYIYKDLPIITGKDFRVDVDHWRLSGDVLNDGLEFLKKMQKSNSLVYDLISELYLTQERGVIVYTSLSQDIPLILGKGQMQRKVNYLNALLDEMGETDLLDKAKYLDFRIDGQIILKKKSEL